MQLINSKFELEMKNKVDNKSNKMCSADKCDSRAFRTAGTFAEVYICKISNVIYIFSKSTTQSQTKFSLKHFFMYEKRLNLMR